MPEFIIIILHVWKTLQSTKKKVWDWFTERVKEMDIVTDEYRLLSIKWVIRNKKKKVKKDWNSNNFEVFNIWVGRHTSCSCLYIYTVYFHFNRKCAYCFMYIMHFYVCTHASVVGCSGWHLQNSASGQVKHSHISITCWSFCTLSVCSHLLDRIESK